MPSGAIVTSQYRRRDYFPFGGFSLPLVFFCPYKLNVFAIA